MEGPPTHLRKAPSQRAEIGDRIVLGLPYLRGNDGGGHYRTGQPDSTSQSPHHLQYVVGQRRHVAVVDDQRMCAALYSKECVTTKMQRSNSKARASRPAAGPRGQCVAHWGFPKPWRS